MIKKGLILGKNGQLSRCLWDEIKKNNTVDDFTFLSRDEINPIKIDFLQKMIKQHHPSFIVNCAAYTDVEKAEEDEENAYQVNALLPKYLGEICHDLNIPIIHISTDYVFDGTKEEAYLPNDPKKPLSVYGRTKSQGEDFLKATCPKSYMLRTSWVYSPYGRNFFNTIYKLLQNQPQLKVISDQVGAPTSAHELARSILALIKNQEAYPFGIYHISGSGKTSWFGFTKKIQELLLTYGVDAHANIEPILTKDYPTRANRPLNSQLHCETFHLPDWQISLKEVCSLVIHQCKSSL